MIKIFDVFKKVKDSVSKEYKNALKIKLLNAPFGIEYMPDVDITQLKVSQSKRLRNLLDHHGLIVIPSHRILNDQEQISITRFFGTAKNETTYIVPSTSTGGIEMNKDKTYISSELWHSESSNTKSPTHISIFQMVHATDNSWSTKFINLNNLYSELDDNVQLKAEGLQVMYSVDDVIHPLVLLHPYTGKPGIYIDFRFANSIFNNCQVTGDILLRDFNYYISQLYDSFKSSSAKYDHHWNIGDILIIDNYAISRKDSLKFKTSTKTALRKTETEGIFF